MEKVLRMALRGRQADTPAAQGLSLLLASILPHPGFVSHSASTSQDLPVLFLIVPLVSVPLSIKVKLFLIIQILLWRQVRPLPRYLTH